MQAIDFSKPLKDLNGKNIPEVPAEEEKESKPLTLGTACINSLASPSRSGPPPEGKKLIEIFDFCTAIHASTEPMELEAEQIVMLKEKVTEFYRERSPFIGGQALKMLEGKL